VAAMSPLLWHPALLRARIAKAVWHWGQGVSFGYPRCCIAHFCWDRLCGRPASLVRAYQIRDDGELPCVPCGIFHAPGSPYGFVGRVWRIAKWQIGRRYLPAGRDRSDSTEAGEQWWSEQAVMNQFSYGDSRGPNYPGSGLDPNLDWD
jgi:hypothetical protein